MLDFGRRRVCRFGAYAVAVTSRVLPLSRKRHIWGEVWRVLAAAVAGGLLFLAIYAGAKAQHQLESHRVLAGWTCSSG